FLSISSIMKAAQCLFVILVISTCIYIYNTFSFTQSRNVQMDDECQTYQKNKISRNSGFDQINTTENFQYKVPNIVHYIWYARKPIEWKFTQYLSVLSASKFIKPSKIMFHTNCTPIGHYWNRTTEIPNLEIIQRSPTSELFGVKVLFFYMTSPSDIDRLLILNTTGGIYLDMDVITLKSFDPLRVYPFTMGSESLTTKVGLNGGIILSEPGSKFLKIWINNYVDDQRSQWAYNSGRMADKLATRFPEDIHIEMTSLNRPSYLEVDQIFVKKYNWHNNYAIHLLVRLWKKHIPLETEINSSDTTFGEISRMVMHGSTDIL
ncbi:unnamed protein product, partial [Owenia fusiformis]